MKKNCAKPSYELSKRELDVMNVFWSVKKATIASEIPKLNPKLNMNTVNTVIKSLLKKNFIKIDDIVYSNTVLARSYLPLVTVEEYTLNYLNSATSSFQYLSKASLFAALLDEEVNDSLLNELDAMIQKRKKPQ